MWACTWRVCSFFDLKDCEAKKKKKTRRAQTDTHIYIHMYLKSGLNAARFSSVRRLVLFLAVYSNILLFVDIFTHLNDECLALTTLTFRTGQHSSNLPWRMSVKLDEQHPLQLYCDHITLGCRPALLLRLLLLLLLPLLLPSLRSVQTLLSACASSLPAPCGLLLLPKQRAGSCRGSCIHNILLDEQI